MVAVAEGGGTEGKRDAGTGRVKTAALATPDSPTGETSQYLSFPQSISPSLSDAVSLHNIAAFHQNFSSRFGLNVGGCEAGVSFGLGGRRWWFELPVE